MKEQANRMYYEVIDEVCNKLIEEGGSVEMDRNIVYALQTEWIKNLEKIQAEEMNQPPVGIEAIANQGTSFSDDEDSELDQLEKNIDSYMMCLFVKVAKTRNKWKCNFKQGFINFDNDDIPFSTATGELEW